MKTPASRNIFLGLIFIILSASFSAHFGFEQGSDIIRDHGEAKILGRIARSASQGVFTDAALLGGCGGENDIYNLDHQTLRYKKKVCPVFSIYKSQSGGQALIYSLLDLIGIPLSFIRALVAMSLALVLSLFVSWLYKRFGFATALVGALGILFMHSLDLLGDNISQVLAVDYLVLVALLFAYERKSRRIWLIALIVMLVKFLLSGFEYAPVVALFAFIPLAFYSIAERLPKRRVIRDACHILSACLIAALIAVAVLSIQVGTVRSFGEIKRHIIERVLTRTLFPVQGQRDVYYKAMETGTAELAAKYFDAPAVKIGRVSIAFDHLIFLFALASGIALYLNRKKPDRDLLALVATTWLGCLGALVWIFLFKGHSAFHTFIDPIVWHMPFSIFGAALVAYTAVSPFKEKP